MRALACFTAILIGPFSLFAEGRTDTDLLRARASEQERQIAALEKEIEQLREQIAFERRRARQPVTQTQTTTGFSPAEATRKQQTPAPAPAASTTAKNTSAVKYTVKSGDTLSAIARRYNTSAPALMKANGITDPTRLGVGQVLTIPGSAPAPSTPKPAAKPAKPEASTPAPPQSRTAPKASTPTHTYKVQSGDTLSRIARQHGMSISEITTMNPEIKPDLLRVGQKISVARQAVAKKATPAPAPSTPSRGVHNVATNKPAPAIQAPAPAPIPQLQPTLAPKPAPKPVASITIADEISYGAFASRYGTTPERLNALNGLTLKGSTVLAKGSELYVATNN